MISVTIYRDELVAHGACATGLALFDSIATPSRKGRMRVRVVDWTPLHAVWLRVAQPNFAGWLQTRGLIPPADLRRAYLRGAYLSGANLRRADLSGAYLRGAYLSRADLSGADLSRADLSGADLSGADLSGADLSRADLSGADLSRADLSGADLSRAYLSGADLSGAYLSGADLSGANLGTGATAPGGWQVSAHGCLRRAA